MMDALIIVLALLIVGGACVTIYAAFAKRLDVMSLALTVTMALQGIMQLERGTLAWSAYVSFAAAAMGLVSTIVQLRRKRTQ